MGASPFSTLFSQAMHVFLCLGCPFSALFYILNINTGLGPEDVVIIDAVAFWLPPDRFANKTWPFGFSPHKIRHDKNKIIRKTLEKCIIPTSALERFVCVIALYYIVVGVFIGIFRAIGPCYVQDWPFIPLLFAWTFPALMVQVLKKRTVSKHPEDEPHAAPDLENDDVLLINVIAIQGEPAEKMRTKILMTLVLSILAHGLAVLITFYAPPTGFGCRSRYLTVISTIWTFNSIFCFAFYYMRNLPFPVAPYVNHL